MKRPANITAIGVLFVVCGGLAAWDFVYGILLQERLSINFAVLMIPVGIGLLRGRASSRMWARCWIGLFAFVAGLAIICGPLFGAWTEVMWFGREFGGFTRYAVSIGMSVGIPVMVLLGARWMLRALSSPSVAPYFDDLASTDAEPNGAANGSRPTRPEIDSTPSAAGSRPLT